MRKAKIGKGQEFLVWRRACGERDRVAAQENAPGPGRKGSLPDPTGTCKASARGRAVWASAWGTHRRTEGRARAPRPCPWCRAPSGPSRDPGIIDAVHRERNAPRPFCLAVPPACSLRTARAWCQVAQKFTGGIGNKLCGECRCPGAGGGQAREPGVPRGRASCSAPHPRLRSRGYSSGDRRGRGSPGGRVGRLTEVLPPCPCPALLYGDAEKPAESGGSEPPRAASRKAACACNQKPCSCPKADINYAFLHATGKGASQGPGSHCPSLCPAPRG